LIEADDLLEAFLSTEKTSTKKKPEPLKSLPAMKLPPPMYNPLPLPTMPPPPSVFKSHRTWGNDFEPLEDFSRKSKLPMPPAPPMAPVSSSTTIYNCPACDRDGLQENDLIKHVLRKHFEKTANLPCPICEKTYGDPQAAKVKDLRSHFETQHVKLNQIPSIVPPPRIFGESGSLPGMVPPIPRVRHELITR
jgi:hypothetical protein